MKKIIEGKRYDTETATLVGQASHGGTGDFQRWEAGLYRTKNGAFFLAGEGGPMTRFAHMCGDGSSTGGNNLFPMTMEDARNWAECNLDIDVVEATFGDSIEDA